MERRGSVDRQAAIFWFNNLAASLTIAFAIVERVGPSDAVIAVEIATYLAVVQVLVAIYIISDVLSNVFVIPGVLGKIGYVAKYLAPWLLAFGVSAIIANVYG